MQHVKMHQYHITVMSPLSWWVSHKHACCISEVGISFFGESMLWTCLQCVYAIAGLLGCQAVRQEPWQGSCQLAALSEQAWTLVIDMMEDEDAEVA